MLAAELGPKGIRANLVAGGLLERVCLYWDAVCCGGVRWVAVCCSVSWCLAVHCSALQCSVLQCVAVCCGVLQCVAVCCSVSRCPAVHCSRLKGIRVNLVASGLLARGYLYGDAVRCGVAVCYGVSRCVTVY